MTTNRSTTDAGPRAAALRRLLLACAAALPLASATGCGHGYDKGTAEWSPPDYWQAERYAELAGLRICYFESGPLEAEVVGFRGDTTLLVPHGELDGIAPRQPVVALGRPLSLPGGVAALGRVLDGLGRPLDGGEPLSGERRVVRAEAPPPLDRPPVNETLQTGVRAIDGLCTLGRGQRLGIFAGSGVGKSSLLGQITRGTDADAIVVCLVGERGREVRDFLDQILGETRDRATVVAATSDRPPLERLLAPFVATSIAESLRDEGKDVLLVMDSVTRFAAASREIGLAAGEPPTVRGYPPSFFATVPRLVERLGRTERGSITGLITVLLEADDPNEPVGDTLRGLLDGHIYLDRKLAHRGHFPAIDPLQSLSRLMDVVSTPEHQAVAALVRQDLAVYDEGRDLVEIGAYRAGTNPRLDGALLRRERVEAFLRQGRGETSALGDTLAGLADIFA